jgi:uncharacterized membrane protein
VTGLLETWALSGDLGRGAAIATCALAAAALLLLLTELARGTRSRGAALAVAATGVLALAALASAVLRPVRVVQRGTRMGGRVLVLLDASRSLDLPEADGTRRSVLARSLPRLRAHFAGARLRALAFGAGSPRALDLDEAGARPSSSGNGDGRPDAAGAEPRFDVPPERSSDLTAALEGVVASTDEQPQAIVVVSDGRLDRPGAERVEEHLRATLGGLAVPVHTVWLAEQEPRDAAVRAVGFGSSVVAHQPSALTVEIACTGGLACDRIPVVARELHFGEPAIERAHGTAEVRGGRATLDLQVTLDRAGPRILEVALSAPSGDRIPDNDRRFVTVDVARDRVRLLHVAGRPTYDVRALRTWLKSDASVDVVAFFILRTHADDVLAPEDELALIPFPVDELFTVHLSSFDAVVLQDFDARPYGLTKHLPALARYVRQGGGLIMVGGPNAFLGGNYAGTPLAEVLPVSLADLPSSERGADLGPFVPSYTDAGRHSPVLAPLRALLGEGLPEMPGTNVVGDVRPGASVLLEHPTLRARAGAAMPVLALGEYGSGRSIALTIDGAHKLLFSTFAAGAAGRAHGAFWDALLGWLMRDPRFEPARVLVPRGCIAGESAELEVRAVFGGTSARADVTVASMASGQSVHTATVELARERPARVALGRLAAGGYTATVQLQGGARGAPTRHDFACEVGGDEWADPRPDRDRLAAIARASGGRAVAPKDIEALPLPAAALLVTERRVRPILPAWAWSLLAAACLGGHWVVRRRAGLS